jgi:flavodoxin
MNTLVVYDSQYGNTERIAQAIADTLRTYGQAQAVHVAQAHPMEFQGVDLLIVGCPTQRWRPTLAMQSFLVNASPQRLGGLAIACFDTRYRAAVWMTGSAARHMDRQLRTMGIEPLVPPESFFVSDSQGPLVSGELDRAVAWARKLVKKAEASHLATR